MNKRAHVVALHEFILNQRNWLVSLFFNKYPCMHSRMSGTTTNGMEWRCSLGIRVQFDELLEHFLVERPPEEPFFAFNIRCEEYLKIVNY